MPTEWIAAELAVAHVCALLDGSRSRAQLELAAYAEQGRIGTRGKANYSDAMMIIPPEKWSEADAHTLSEPVWLEPFLYIEFSRSHLHALYPVVGLKTAPTPKHVKRSGGARPKFDWHAIMGEALRRIYLDGIPSSDRAFATDLLEWCHVQFGDDVPSESVMRENVAKWLAPLRSA
jgi:hypothetical protein